MADREGSALGLSIGATNLAAVTADRSVTRKPVLTLYRQRAPEVGVPTENPKLNEPGLVISDFVDRAGDPAGIAAADSSTHRSETLVADALLALAYTATDGRPLPDAVAVTHPAHWDAVAVDSVRVALSRVSEWSHGRLALLPDSTAVLFALQMSPGLPNSGTIAVCDFGGSGATVSLVDAANGYQVIAPAVRTEDFSGDRIDQAVLTHVVGDRPAEQAADRLPLRKRTALLNDGDRVDRRCARLSWRDPDVPRRARGCDPSAAARLHRLLAGSAGVQWDSPD
jgi:molecular chaperone DnaK (HSP70)